MNLTNYYWYFQSAVPARICDDISKYGKQLQNGITSSATSGIILVDFSQFPTAGTNFLQIDSEEISYTGIASTGELTGVTRGVGGTTAAAHNAGATITSTTTFIGWGEAASGDLVLEPGMW